MEEYILSHDVGTSGDKATLFETSGRLVGSAFASYETSYPQAGWAEQDANDYWKAFCTATRELLERTECEPTAIAVVAVSGQMMAGLPVDVTGAPLRRSLIWADQRATEEQQELTHRLDGERVYRITGQRMSPSYTVPKMMWCRRHEPEVYKRTAKFIQAKDYLVGRLTGVVGTDYSDASGVMALDLQTLTWSDEILEAAGISQSLLPEIRESTEIAGKITQSAASECGLAGGTPVAVGGADGACATCGAGVVRPGDAYLCVGTSTWIASATDRPMPDPKQRTVTFAHLQRGLYFPCGPMQAGGGSLKWFKDTLYASEAAETRDGDIYDLVNRMAASVPAGSERLLFLPYLMGERSPHWDPEARGCFIGLSMIHRKAHMARAVMEGVAYNMKIIASAFSEIGAAYSQFRIIGGGAKSPVWLQIFADVLDRSVAPTSHTDEATSIGAAIAGGVGVGLFESIGEAERIVTTVDRVKPRPEAERVYRRQYAAFLQSYEQLKPVFTALSR